MEIKHEKCKIANWKILILHPSLLSQLEPVKLKSMGQGYFHWLEQKMTPEEAGCYRVTLQGTMKKILKKPKTTQNKQKNLQITQQRNQNANNSKIVNIEHIVGL